MNPDDKVPGDESDAPTKKVRIIQITIPKALNEQFRQAAWRDGVNKEEYVAKLLTKIATPGTEERRQIDEYHGSFRGRTEILARKILRMLEKAWSRVKSWLR